MSAGNPVGGALAGNLFWDRLENHFTPEYLKARRLSRQVYGGPGRRPGGAYNAGFRTVDPSSVTLTDSQQALLSQYGMTQQQRADRERQRELYRRGRVFSDGGGARDVAPAYVGLPVAPGIWDGTTTTGGTNVSGGGGWNPNLYPPATQTPPVAEEPTTPTSQAPNLKESNLDQYPGFVEFIYNQPRRASYYGNILVYTYDDGTRIFHDADGNPYFVMVGRSYNEFRRRQDAGGGATPTQHDIIYQQVVLPRENMPYQIKIHTRDDGTQVVIRTYQDGTMVYFDPLTGQAFAWNKGRY